MSTEQNASAQEETLAQRVLRLRREIEYHTHHLLETHDVEGFEYSDDRLVPNPKRPTKRASRTGRGRRRPSLRRR